MNKILTVQLIYRRILTLRTINKQCLHSSSKLLKKDDSSSDSSSSDSDSDGNKNKKEIKEKQPSENATMTKSDTQDLLNSLLIKMSKETSRSKTYRAIPKKIEKPKPLKTPTLEESILTAAKEAADLLGGDKEKTRKKLTEKIFSAGKSKASQTEKSPEESKDTKTESSKVSLSQLLTGMKIERSPSQTSLVSGYSRASKIKELVNRFQEREINDIIPHRRVERSANLFRGTRLNIFDKVQEGDELIGTQNMAIWRALEQKEFKLLLERPPENIFEEMIQWTEKGLLWKFPINNEIGYEEEESVHFSEHVFMERHIQDWCPKKGPIRHFMELVCVGLSKNPYMKVQEKIDHIMWFKEFFGDRQEILKEIGAIQHDIISPQDNKQIQA